MRYWRRLALAALCFLPACGGSGGGTPAAEVVRVYWFTGLSGDGFDHDTLVIEFLAPAESGLVQVSSSNGAFNATPATIIAQTDARLDFSVPREATTCLGTLTTPAGGTPHLVLECDGVRLEGDGTSSSPFVGTYSGNYNGADAGLLQMGVDAQGRVTASGQSTLQPGGILSGAGSVSRLGQVNLALLSSGTDQGVHYAFDGWIKRLDNGTLASGAWINSLGEHGNWTLLKQ